MALDRLTKVDGGGISTTSDYRVGIITASKFVGPFDGTGGNFSGVVTATNGVFSGNISAVDGNFSGNVTIGGTLTYEDVTNIDSVGIITAQKDIHVGAGLSVVGVSTFKGNVRLLDNDKLQFGDNQDLQIYHDGSHSLIEDTGTGFLYIRTNGDRINLVSGGENLARFIANGAAELYYDNNLKLDTRSNGINVTGRIFCDGALANNRGLIFNDNVKISLGSSNDLEIFHDGSNSKIVDGGTGSLLLLSDSFKVQNAAGTENQIIANENGAVDLYFNNNLRLSSANYGANIFGQSAAVSFQLYTQGGHKRGGLYATNSNVISLLDAQDHNILRGVKDGTAELYYDNGKRFETLSSGVQVTGTFAELIFNCLNGTGKQYKFRASGTNSTGFELVDVTLNQRAYLYHDSTYLGGVHHFHTNSILRLAIEGANVNIPNDTTRLRFGASADLQLWHDGSHSYIDDSGTGNLYIQSNHVNIDSKNGEQFINCIQDGAVELYHNNVKKLETTSAGADFSLSSGGQVNLYHLGSDGGLRISGPQSASSATLFFNTNHQNVSGGTDQYTITCGGANHTLMFKRGDMSGTTVLELDDIQHVRIPQDGKALKIGASQDLQLVHTGTYSNIYNATGDLDISSDVIRLKNGNRSETFAAFINNGQSELYYDNSRKFNTSPSGITVYGEVAASQDYPNIRPVLDFNFAATKKLRPEMTFARNGEASYHDGVGSVKFVSDNEPRFEHDIITGECKGLMFEGAGTNYSWHSRQFYSSGYPANSWVPINGGAAPTITENTHTAPDGTSSGVYMADTITGATGTTVSGNVVRQQWTSGTSVKHTVSIYVKLLTATQATIYLRDANTGSTQTASAVNIKGWQRLVVTSSSAMTASVNHSWFIGNTNGTIAVWGSQIERSDYVSSYIKTTGGANGTRNADAGVQLDGEDFTDAFNEGKGTLIAEAIPTLSLSNQVIVGLHQDFSDVNRIEVRSMGNNTANARFEVVDSGSSVVFNNSLPHSGINNVSKFGFAVEKDNYAMCVNGGTVATDTSGAFPSGINSMLIGDAAYAVDSSMIIKRIMYYSDRLPNSQLITLTS